jgi:hypothetical protein
MVNPPISSFQNDVPMSPVARPVVEPEEAARGAVDAQTSPQRSLVAKRRGG